MNDTLTECEVGDLELTYFLIFLREKRVLRPQSFGGQKMLRTTNKERRNV